jgi:hypothetical protein
MLLGIIYEPRKGPAITHIASLIHMHYSSHPVSIRPETQPL